MKEAIKEFEKTKDFLICVDSDGCVLDTMDVKHMRCLGPCLVHVWNLEEYRDEIIRLWRKVNLFSPARGLNRFRGLAKVLAEIHENYVRVEGLSEYIYWVQTTREHSDESLEEAFERTGSSCIRKAMEWSNLVNQSMAMISDKKKQPFDGAREALESIRSYADVVVVTAANGAEIRKEWEAQSLIQYTDLLVSQETGRKAECLKKLVQKGYEPGHVLMIGDSPADLKAAKEAGALFYPVLVYQERESWEAFPEILKQFLKGTYSSEEEARQIQEFQKNFGVQ